MGQIHDAPSELKTRSHVFSQIEAETPRLRRYALFLARNADHADDLVQDCLVRALAKIDSWQPGTNLRAWLFTILRNGFLNECRRSKKERHVMRDPKLAEPYVFPAQQDARLILAELEGAFMELSVDHREILTLIAIENFSYEQAAELLGVSIGTIKSRLWRARSRLSELLNNHKLAATVN